MDFENSFSVDAPPSLVYEYLTDPARIVGCIPGAELLEELPGGAFAGRIRIKLGPVVVNYKGQGKLAKVDPTALTATLEGQAREQGGAGTVGATAELSVRESGAGAVVCILTDVAITGKAAQFGKGVLTEVSKKIVEQLSSNLATRIASDSQQSPTNGTDNRHTTPQDASGAQLSERVKVAPPAPPTPAAPLNAGALLWALVKARVAALVRTLLRKKPR